MWLTSHEHFVKMMKWRSRHEIKAMSAKTQGIFELGFTFSIRRLCYWKQEANLSEAKANLSSPQNTRGKQYTLLFPNSVWVKGRRLLNSHSLIPASCKASGMSLRMMIIPLSSILKCTLIEIQQPKGGKIIKKGYGGVNTGYVIQKWATESWCWPCWGSGYNELMVWVLEVLSPSASRKAIVFHYRFY